MIWPDSWPKAILFSLTSEQDARYSNGSHKCCGSCVGDVDEISKSFRNGAFDLRRAQLFSLAIEKVVFIFVMNSYTLSRKLSNMGERIQASHGVHYCLCTSVLLVSQGSICAAFR